jgi:hypothetical protein
MAPEFGYKQSEYSELEINKENFHNSNFVDYPEIIPETFM